VLTGKRGCFLSIWPSGFWASCSAPASSNIFLNASHPRNTHAFAPFFAFEYILLFQELSSLFPLPENFWSPYTA
jgi:hypothetical protein